MLVKIYMEQKKRFSWTNLPSMKCFKAYDFSWSYSLTVLHKKYLNLSCISEVVVSFTLLVVSFTINRQFCQFFFSEIEAECLELPYYGLTMETFYCNFWTWGQAWNFSEKEQPLGDPWVAQQFSACLWHRAWSWSPGIESHIGFPAWSLLLLLCLCLSL